MTYRSLALGLALSLAACATDPGATLDDAEGEAVVIRSSHAPTAVRWEDRDAHRSLWSRDATRAVVVLGPSTSPRRFVAYGVDAGRGTLRWVLDVAVADYQEFLSIEAGDWTESVGFDNDANHGVLGSVKSPGPQPPQPGQPPIARTVAAVTQVAADVDVAIDAGKLVLPN
jgi:hypothetical protein